MLFIEIYNSMRPNNIVITYEITHQHSTFLDLEILKGKRILTGKLDCRVFQKPNNQYLYIPPFSFHASKMFESMIIAELTRYMTLCTNNQDFIIAKSLYFDRLLARGYKTEFLNITFSQEMDRQTIVNKRLSKINLSINKSKTPAIIVLPFTMRSNCVKLSNILANDAIFDPTFYEIFGAKPKVITCFKRPQNLGDVLRSSKYKLKVTQLN